jgi:hypothetical protein
MNFVLQKPQIIFSELGDFVAGEMGEDFGHHFGVFYCYRQILLAN